MHTERASRFIRGAAALIATMTLACAQATTPVEPPLLRYVDAWRGEPLQATALGESTSDGITRRDFRLVSQSWAPVEGVQRKVWCHGVAIYSPALGSGDTALGVVLVGGGTTPAKGVTAPLRAPHASASAIVKATGLTVIQIEAVPNQPIDLGDGIPRREDDAVAASWRLYLDDPGHRPYASLHIPMAMAVVRAMDLAQRETGISRFLVAGISKRGWAAWLAAAADPRISGLVPIASDIADPLALVNETRLAYAGRWPIALADYVKAGVLEHTNTHAFAALMRISDPLAYRHALDLPIYMVLASGDDFFVPDHAAKVMGRMPRPPVLRYLPNSDHGGSAAFEAPSVIAMAARMARNRPMPTVRDESMDDGRSLVTVNEDPVKVTIWTALNARSRDFRHACGIRYIPAVTTTSRRLHLDAPLPHPGWSARFVEFELADGMVVTTPVSIHPTGAYPSLPPEDTGAACRTLADEPGRAGL